MRPHFHILMAIIGFSDIENQVAPESVLLLSLAWVCFDFHAILVGVETSTSSALQTLSPGVRIVLQVASDLERKFCYLLCEEK